MNAAIVVADTTNIIPIINGIKDFLYSAFSSTEPIINFIPIIEPIKTAIITPHINNIL